MRWLQENWKTKLVCLALAVIVWSVVMERQNPGFLRALATGNLPGETRHAPRTFIPVKPSADDANPN